MEDWCRDEGLRLVSFLYDHMDHQVRAYFFEAAGLLAEKMGCLPERYLKPDVVFKEKEVVARMTVTDQSHPLRGLTGDVLYVEEDVIYLWVDRKPYGFSPSQVEKGW